MGTILASKLRDDCAAILLDRSLTRHADDYLQWINDGQVVAASLKPDVSTALRVLSMIPGIHQTISIDAHMMIRPVRNIGPPPDNTPGQPIFTVDYDHFTNNNPSWMEATPDVSVMLVMLDERVENGFFVYPPQPTGETGRILALEAVVPPRLDNYDQPIFIKDIHEPNLLQYMLFRGYSVTSSHIAKTSAMSAWNMFVTGLGRKDMIDKAISPNTARRALQGDQNAG